MIAKIRQSLTLQMILIALLGCGIFTLICWLRNASPEQVNKYQNRQSHPEKTSYITMK